MPIFRSFPDSPSLDQLRRQAKELQAELAKSDDAARERVADPTFQGTPFGWACEDRKVENMRTLRELGYRPDVWEAARTGDLALVKGWIASSPALLDRARWGTPLCEACAWDQLEVASWLLSQGADPELPSRDGRLPMALAQNDAIRALIGEQRGKRV